MRGKNYHEYMDRIIRVYRDPRTNVRFFIEDNFLPVAALPNEARGSFPNYDQAMDCAREMAQKYNASIRDETRY